jgi:two-component system, OmpR family, sensor histidine kinase KdpD
MPSWRAPVDTVLRRPAAATVAGFAMAVAVGTILLWLPMASEDRTSAGLVTALFTAVSAVCVTGLIVVDTPTYWSAFGELAILGMIQVGGIGIMTLATLLGLLISRRVGLRLQLTAQAETKTLGLGEVRRVVVRVLLISVIIEVLTALVLLAAALIAVADRGLLGLPTAVPLFMLTVVVVAVVGGLGPALLAAVASGLLLNYFLTAPLDSFHISEPGNALTLAVMLIVAVMVALVVDHAAKQAEAADRARTEAGLLSGFAETVLSHEPLPLLLHAIREAFGATSASLLERHDREWRPVASAGPDSVAAPETATTDVTIRADLHLALLGRPLTAGERRVLQAVAGQVHLALQAHRLAIQALDAQRRAEATELRSALLSAVGHDLRTPLTSIKAAMSSLRDPEITLSAADTIELLVTVEESTDRLQALVDNLLDSARLATGAAVPQLRPVGYDEVVVRALASLDGGQRVTIEVDSTVPAVHADPGLLERVVANLADNALRHGGGAPVTIRAVVRGPEAELRVIDTGPGLPTAAVDALFVPFQRLGDRTSRPGVGLGLAVARGFTEAMGGRLSAEHTSGGGLTMTLALPLDPASQAPPPPAGAAPGLPS